MSEPNLRNMEGALEPKKVSTKQERIAELAKLNPAMAFTSLNHHLDLEWLREAYNLTRKDGAVGVDGQTAAEYESNLEANLGSLLERMKSGRYRAPAVRRVHIPKGKGKTRPIGIPTFEDKVAQRAIVMLLEPIYEEDFLDYSFGFRRGRSAHQALTTLRSHIMGEGVRWVLDVDIQAYFDTIEHEHLREFLAKRVTDGVVRRMIDKWLKAGVLERGQLRRSETGTPQGGVLSPLLANIYLHYVLDEWWAGDVVPRMKRSCSLVRYADDFVMMFADLDDCERVQRVLGERLKRFGLRLHPDKTQMVDLRLHRPNGKHPKSDGTTFNFLGFTHVWGKSKRGYNVIWQITAKDRFARALRAIHEWCKAARHMPVEKQQVILSRKMRGHYAYYGITGNNRRLVWYARKVEEIWRYWLLRRSRDGQRGWKWFERLQTLYTLPPPRVVHRYT